MKKWIYNLIHPNNYVIVGGILITILSLFYLVEFDKFNTAIAYILYVTMSYFLTIFCVKLSEMLKCVIGEVVNRNEYLRKYVNNPKFKYEISLLFSLFLNIVYVLFKLIIGIYYKSLWFISFAIYYFLLVIMRKNIAKEEIKQKSTLMDEYLIYRKIGIILLFINLFLTVIILLIVNENILTPYNVYMVIGIACYTFYLLINSVKNLFKYRKYKSLLMLSAKIIDVIASLISMLSLEITMLSTFGAYSTHFNEIMIMATGGGISIIIIIISLQMIITSTEWLKNKRKSRYF